MSPFEGWPYFRGGFTLSDIGWDFRDPGSVTSYESCLLGELFLCLQQLRAESDYFMRTDDGEAICTYIEAFQKDPVAALVSGQKLFPLMIFARSCSLPRLLAMV